MVLPGNQPKSLRLRFVEIIRQYLAGDKRLAQELELNSESTHPVHCLARQDVTPYKRRKVQKQVFPKVSYIYATFSPAFPGLVKIGRSANVKARLSSGNCFAAPCKHQVIAVAPTFDDKRDEKLVHNHFAQFRQAGEFFEIPHQNVVHYFANTIMSRYQDEMHQFTQGESGGLRMIEWNSIQEGV